MLLTVKSDILHVTHRPFLILELNINISITERSLYRIKFGTVKTGEECSL